MRDGDRVVLTHGDDARAVAVGARGHALAEPARRRGPLFDDCSVTWEEVDGGAVTLASVEGITVELA